MRRAILFGEALVATVILWGIAAWCAGAGYALVMAWLAADICA